MMTEDAEVQKIKALLLKLEEANLLLKQAQFTCEQAETLLRVKLGPHLEIINTYEKK